MKGTKKMASLGLAVVLLFSVFIIAPITAGAGAPTYFHPGIVTDSGYWYAWTWSDSESGYWLKGEENSDNITFYGLSEQVVFALLSEDLDYSELDGESWGYTIHQSDDLKVEGDTFTATEWTDYNEHWDSDNFNGVWSNSKAPDTEPASAENEEPNPVEEKTEPTSETESVPATKSVEPTATEPVAQASDIWVGGVKVTESNASNITGSGISGKISYNAATNTLTLENAEITSAYEEEAEGGNSNPFVGGIFSKNSLNIELIGENTIEVTDAVPSESKNYNLYGVIVKGNLTISGSGKLTTEGMCGNSLNIKKDADVNSTVSVGMRVRIRNAVTFETITVEGKLYAKCSTVFLDYPAVVTKNFTVCEGAEVTVYASNVIPSTPSPYAAKCISIMNGGTLTVNGDLSVTAEGTIAGDSSSSQRNNGYGIYGESDNCTVVLGNTGNLTASGKASAVRNITFSIPSDLFVIKAGSSEENAEETELSGINSQKYISFETTYVPPVTEPATTTTDEPTTPGEEPTTPGETPTTPSEEPTTPGEEPTTPGETPTTPGEEPTTPSEEPTTPSETPTTPTEQPTTPDGKKDISGWTVEGLKNVAYTGKVIKQELNVVSSDGEYAEFKTVYKNNKKVGTATVIITGTGDYAGTITKTFKITKAKQSMTAKAVSKSVKLKDVKKKNVTVKKAITVKKNHGSVSYAKVSKGSSKYLTISKKGVITFKKWKKAKKGTYKIVVNVTAKGNTNYKKLSKKVTVKIKVK